MFARKRLLILGGTTEARALAEQAQAELGDRLEIVTSLAGRTADPLAIAGDVRRGGFGGADALAAYLRNERIDLLVDATHPYAGRISEHAASAASHAAIPRLMLVRPPWHPGDGDHWIPVADADEAAWVVPKFGRRVWLTVGSDDVAAFTGVRGTWFLIRRIDTPARPMPLPDHTLILGRGPFALDGERRLIDEHRIDCLVCRNSGGEATRAKLDAAREAGLPVIMIARPSLSEGEIVDTPARALLWLRSQVNS